MKDAESPHELILGFSFILGFGVYDLYRIKIGALHRGKFPHLEFAVLRARFIHCLLMTDRAGAIQQCFTGGRV